MGLAGDHFRTNSRQDGSGSLVERDRRLVRRLDPVTTSYALTRIAYRVRYFRQSSGFRWWRTLYRLSLRIIAARLCKAASLRYRAEAGDRWVSRRRTEIPKPLASGSSSMAALAGSVAC